MKPEIAIIDYGAGNVRSVYYALKRLGCNALITKSADEVKRAQRVIFPGVGHAKSAMENLHATRLNKVLPKLSQPVLGICLGMQLMCNENEESGLTGLGIFDVPVLKFNAELKVPKIGWNRVVNGKSLLAGMEGYGYFVHSYYVPISAAGIATARYGVEYCAAIQKDNFIGCQFHPEKSGAFGEEILKAFVTWN